ncbi:MAG: hypothetical protein H7228_04385 [Polaromonas sp.]|nr:hypothetical protein [Polaromonas sp.]
MTPSKRIVRNKATETETTGKGMPVRLQQTDRTRLGAAQTQHDASVEASLALPHERDQSTDMTASKPDPVIKQALRDVSRGLTDTSKGVEMNSAYKKLK